MSSPTFRLRPSRDAIAPTAIACAIAAHAVLTASLALARYESFHNRTFDLALYARMSWGLVHGEAWDPIVGGNFFGGHMPFVLVPLGLLGRVTAIVPLLLCVQSLALALAAWPLSQFAARRFGATGGLLAALSWLLQPNLGHVATYEFHPGSLALYPLCIALDALDREQDRRFALANLAVLACRVSLALQTLPLALLALFRSRPLRRVGRLVLVGSALYFLVSQLWLAPRFGVAAHSSADLHFGPWGGSPFGILPALVHRPAAVLAHLSAPERLRYPLLVLGPFAFLPLLAPRYLLVALPPLALNLISVFPTAAQLYSHYLTPALPPLAFGAVEGAALLRDRMHVRAGALLTLGALTLAAAAGSVLGSGLPWAADFERAAFERDAQTRDGRAVVRRVGASASVQAPDPLLPHLAERRLVTRMPPPDRGTAFVVFDISHRRRFAQQETLLRTTEEPIVRALMARPDFEAVAREGDWLVLQRGAPARAMLRDRYLVGRADPQSGQALSACLRALDASLRALDLALDFVASAPCPPDLALRFGPDPKPTRVDLLFDGLVSPAHLARGEHVRSTHSLSAAERAAILQHGLHLGVLRARGAPPAASDPISIALGVRVEP